MSMLLQQIHYWNQILYPIYYPYDITSAQVSLECNSFVDAINDFLSAVWAEESRETDKDLT